MLAFVLYCIVLYCVVFRPAHSYFIPEDGDDELQPNVFLAPKPRTAGTPPTLGQVKNAFPLPGHYHFRFKSPLYPGGDRDKGAIPVWMDLVNDSAPVATWKNSIVAKVTRLSAEEEDDDDDEDFGVSTPTPAAPPASSNPRAPPSHQSSVASTGSSDHLDIFGGPSPVNAAPAPAPAATTPNLFDAHHPPAPASGGSLLDMNDFGGQPAASSAHADFLGMTAPAPAPTPQRPPQAGVPPQAQGYPAGNMMHQGTPQQPQRPPQQNAFNNFSNRQGPFGGLGQPWNS